MWVSDVTAAKAQHQSVMLEEVIELLSPKPGGIYVDGTLGRGGHAEAILSRIMPGGFLLGFDKDAEALARAEQRLEQWRGNFELVHASFTRMAEVAAQKGIKGVDGIVMDLGVSSEQIGTPGRGFSFREDGPLDMRMDKSRGVTAAELVQCLSESELADLIYRFGEERRSRQIARAIVRTREKGPIRTTGQLAAVVESVSGGHRGRIHPATRTFQALRIKVNAELDDLEQGLEGGLALLKGQGRMAVISFHSLEDRIVKHFFAGHAGRWESLQAGGRRWHGVEPAVRLITRKPVVASEAEINANPRSRSAKLRVAEKKEKEDA